MKKITKFIMLSLLVTANVHAMVYNPQTNKYTPINNTISKKQNFGGNSTIAPKTFTPSDSFLHENPNYAGNYFSNTASATIHDPNLMSENGYSFTNVEKSTALNIDGKVQIGYLSNNGTYLHGVQNQ